MLKERAPRAIEPGGRAQCLAMAPAGDCLDGIRAHSNGRGHLEV